MSSSKKKRSVLKRYASAVIVCALLIITAMSALAGSVDILLNLAQNFEDDCYYSSDFDDGIITDFTVVNTCQAYSRIRWTGDVNLTILGNVSDGEVVLADTWAYVDSVARPDLDAPATIIFEKLAYAVEPLVYKDWTTCIEPVCNITYSPTLDRLTVQVGGFSNYSYAGRQDFDVFTDFQPELQEKVYQAVDLGDARRSSNFTCTVEIYGRNQDSNWVLVQTNPEREVQGRILGNPDQNQPESLGYFPVTNGVATTYFRGDELPGYSNFNLVVRCVNPSSSLIYEEAIMTTYAPVGRELKARGVWWSIGDNAFYISVYVIGGLIALWVLMMILRTIFRSARKW